MYALAAGAGVVLLVPHDHDAASMALNLTHWALMVVAMMLPLAAPRARHVALRALWRRRQRAIVEFLAGYLAVWFALGLALVTVLTVAGHPEPPPAAVAAALLGAALWHVSRPRRRVMRRCGSFPPAASRGWAATRDTVRGGWLVGIRCAATCGPLMLVVGVSHGLLLMAATSGVLLSERRRGPNPHRRAGRAREAWCIVGLAAMLGVLPSP